MKAKVYLIPLFIFTFLFISNHDLKSQPGGVLQGSPISIDLVSASFINQSTGYTCGGTKILKTTVIFIKEILL